MVLAVLAVVLAVGPASGQDTPSTVTPAPDIIPRPNAGEAPDDAGDRGGALQLAVLAAVTLGIGGAVVHLVRQARRPRPPGP